jgi:hypothetical protein
VPHPPRFRALALFGRRPPERVDRLGIPASENLHKTGPNAQALVKLYRGIADVCSFSVTVEKNRFYYD